MYTRNISLTTFSTPDRNLRNIVFDAEEYQKHVLDLIDITNGKIIEPPRFDEMFAEVQYLVGWPSAVDYRNFKFWMTLYWPKHSEIEISPESYWDSTLLSEVQRCAKINRHHRAQRDEFWLFNDKEKFDKKYVGAVMDERIAVEVKFLLICKLNGIQFIDDSSCLDETLSLLQQLKNGSYPSKNPTLEQTLKEERKQEKIYQKRYKQWFKDKN